MTTRRIPPRHSAHIRVPANADDDTLIKPSVNKLADMAVMRDRDQREVGCVAVAYVAHAPACQFSEDLVDLAEECNVPVEIYDVETLGPPEWLEGTPTIETRDGEIYCGDAAFEWVASQAETTRDFSERARQDATDERMQAQQDDGAGGYNVFSSAGVGNNLHTAMVESNRMAEMAEKACSEPLMDVQKTLDKMMSMRKD